MVAAVLAESAGERVMLPLKVAFRVYGELGEIRA